MHRSTATSQAEAWNDFHPESLVSFRHVLHLRTGHPACQSCESRAGASVRFPAWTEAFGTSARAEPGLTSPLAGQANCLPWSLIAGLKLQVSGKNDLSESNTRRVQAPRNMEKSCTESNVNQKQLRSPAHGQSQLRQGLTGPGDRRQTPRSQTRNADYVKNILRIARTKV